MLTNLSLNLYPHLLLKMVEKIDLVLMPMLLLILLFSCHKYSPFAMPSYHFEKIIDKNICQKALIPMFEYTYNYIQTYLIW